MSETELGLTLSIAGKVLQKSSQWVRSKLARVSEQGCYRDDEGVIRVSRSGMDELKRLKATLENKH